MIAIIMVLSVFVFAMLVAVTMMVIESLDLEREVRDWILRRLRRNKDE